MEHQKTMNIINQPEICSLYTFIKESTDIVGLNFFPTLIGHSNDDDASAPGAPTPPSDNSKTELRILRTICKKFKNTPINIMEIGVNRAGDNSFTKILIDTKHNESKYLGVDIEDKSRLNAPLKNIMTYQIDSSKQVDVRKKLESLSMAHLNILLIDGWHSVNMAVNDWKYSDLVVSGGYVIIHDVHWHPGPRMLIEAIDKTKYDVQIPTKFRSKHYGIGIIKKL